VWYLISFFFHGVTKYSGLVGSIFRTEGGVTSLILPYWTPLHLIKTLISHPTRQEENIIVFHSGKLINSQIQGTHFLCRAPVSLWTTCRDLLPFSLSLFWVCVCPCVSVCVCVCVKDRSKTQKAVAITCEDVCSATSVGPCAAVFITR